MKTPTLRQYLNDTGRKLTWLVSATGIPRSTLTRIALGRSVPKLDAAQRIVDALGTITLDDLFDMCTKRDDEEEAA